MALIKCKECGHDVSTKATSCPNCGAPPEIFNLPQVLVKKVKSTDKITRLDLNTYLKEQQTRQEDAKRKDPRKDNFLIYLLSVIFSIIFCLGIVGFFISYFIDSPRRPPLGFRGNLGYEGDEGFVPVFISEKDIKKHMNDIEIGDSIIEGKAFFVTRGTVAKIIGKGSGIYQIKLLGDGTQTQEALLELYPKQSGWIPAGWIMTVDDYLIQKYSRAKTTQSSSPSESPELPEYINYTIRVGYMVYEVFGVEWKNRLGDELRQYPDAKFLVIDIGIENVDTRPRTVPPFKLIDNEGREYQESSKGIFMDSAIGLLKNLNPNVTTHGYLVFDVPQGNYKLLLSGGYWSSEKRAVRLY